MSKRFLVLALLFVLGCGGSLFAGFALAGGFDEGFLDEHLYYEDNGEKITFTHTGTKDGYWIVVDGKVAPSSPGSSDSAVVVHENLKTMKIYKVTPVSFWELENGFRPCNPSFQDCPLPKPPLPPPPPPVMPGEEPVRPEEYGFAGDWH